MQTDPTMTLGAARVRLECAALEYARLKAFGVTIDPVNGAILLHTGSAEVLLPSLRDKLLEAATGLALEMTLQNLPKHPLSSAD